jgi:hypothetical protein
MPLLLPLLAREVLEALSVVACAPLLWPWPRKLGLVSSAEVAAVIELM